MPQIIISKLKLTPVLILQIAVFAIALLIFFIFPAKSRPPKDYGSGVCAVEDNLIFVSASGHREFLDVFYY